MKVLQFMGQAPGHKASVVLEKGAGSPTKFLLLGLAGLFFPSLWLIPEARASQVIHEPIDLPELVCSSSIVVAQLTKPGIITKGFTYEGKSRTTGEVKTGQFSGAIWHFEVLEVLKHESNLSNFKTIPSKIAVINGDLERQYSDDRAYFIDGIMRSPFVRSYNNNLSPWNSDPPPWLDQPVLLFLRPSYLALSEENVRGKGFRKTFGHAFPSVGLETLDKRQIVIDLIESDKRTDRCGVVAQLASEAGDSYNGS